VTSVSYLKFVKIREFYEIVKVRVGTKIVTTSFRIYSEATVEWEDWLLMILAVTLRNTMIFHQTIRDILYWSTG